MNKTLCSEIYHVVRRIPRGRVATYGQIARIAKLGRRARFVGQALWSVPSGVAIPWHRVINAKGEISPRSYDDSHELQRHLLEAEGIEISLEGKIDLEKFRWRK